MSPGSEGCLRGVAGFDTIHPQSPVVTGEVCAPTNLVFTVRSVISNRLRGARAGGAPAMILQPEYDFTTMKS